MHANCRVGRAGFLEFLPSEIFWNSSFQKFWFWRVFEFEIWDFWKLVLEFGFCPIEYVVLLDFKFLDRYSACVHPQPLQLLVGGIGKKIKINLIVNLASRFIFISRRWLQKQRSKNWKKSRISTFRSHWKTVRVEASRISIKKLEI